MKQIPLTQGQFAIVDDADYDWLNQYKWHVVKLRGYFYAKRKEAGQTILMHRQILGLNQGDKRQADHRNHNTLNNCRCNIRRCTSQENHFNQKLRPNTTSRFKGVSWHKLTRKWRARIHINGKQKYLGLFNMEEVAALRYDMVAIREHGEFACLNF